MEMSLDEFNHTEKMGRLGQAPSLDRLRVRAVDKIRTWQLFLLSFPTAERSTFYGSALCGTINSSNSMIIIECHYNGGIKGCRAVLKLLFETGKVDVDFRGLWNMRVPTFWQVAFLEKPDVQV
jgi:hypothetical protein